MCHAGPLLQPHQLGVAPSTAMMLTWQLAHLTTSRPAVTLLRAQLAAGSAVELSRHVAQVLNSAAADVPLQ